MFLKNSVAVYIALILAVLVGSSVVPSVHAATLTVTNINDSGPGSLRQAIATSGPGDTITFDPALAGETVVLATELDITHALTIDGSNINPQLSISGTNAVRVFYIHPDVTVTLNDLSIEDGVANTVISSTWGNSGGGIYNDGNLTVNNSTVSGNTASQWGGGIFNSDTGTLTVTNSTLSNNTATGSSNPPSGWGGGILSIYRVTIANSTFSNNSAEASPSSVGGGIFVHGSGIITNSTLSGNSAGDGAGILIDADATLTFSNTIIANSHYSTYGHDCANLGTLVTNTNNLVEDGSCSALLSGDSQLGPLADNGGFTQTFALLAGSPAIDAGNDASCPATDQRGISRPQGAHCDIGAFEYVFLGTPTNTPTDTLTDTATFTPASTPTDTATPTSTSPMTPTGTLTDLPLLVTSNADDGTANPADCPSASNCRLRDAIAAAAGDDVISFDPGLSGETITLSSTLAFSRDVTIDGSGLSSPISISGNNAVRVFYINPSVNVTLNNLNIQNGFTDSSSSLGYSGAGIYNDGGLTLNDSTVSSNIASDSGFGGGIYNSSTGTLLVTNSTFSGNSANDGGGVYSDGFLAIANSTFANNVASLDTDGNGEGGYGGGVFNNSDQSNMAVIRNSTFSNNIASAPDGGYKGQGGGGGIASVYWLEYINTIIANSTGGDCLNTGTLDPGSLNNLVEDGACSASLSGDPKLGSLADNGGSTQTFALLAGSPAIDGGNDAFCESTDQRGVSRPQGAHCDIGAFEYVYPATPTSTSTTTNTPTFTPTYTPTFTPTATSTPAMPGLFNKTSPVNGATNQSVNPTLTWGASTEAASYEYCYDTTNDNSCSSWSTNGASTNANLNGLSPNTTYYWQVRAVNSTGQTYANGSTTAFWSFKTSALPSGFNKSSPVNNSLKQPINPILKWAASAGATSYEYCYDRINNNVCDTSWITAPATTVTLSNLSNNTIYYWQVRAINLGGAVYANVGAWWNFKVVLAPPSLSLPTSGTSTHTTFPTFTWSDSNTTGVTGYTIQISKNNTFTSIVNTGSPTTTSYTPAKALPVSSTLYWRVQTKGANGPSLWSAPPVWSFTTGNPPSIPVLLSPANNLLTTTYSPPTFTWKASTPAADHYEIQVATDSAFASEFFHDTTTALTYPSTLTLNPNTTYYWHVRAYNTSGDFSGWSTTWSLRAAMVPPTLSAPANSTDPLTLRPTFSWDPVPGVSDYSIQVSKNNTFTQIVLSGLTIATNLTPTKDLPAASVAPTLYWHVQALGPNGPSLWSSPTWQINSPNPPSVPVLTSPVNASLSTMPTYQPTLVWKPVTLPSLPVPTTFGYYHVQVSTSSTFASTPVLDDTSLTTLNSTQLVVAPALKSDTTYYWHVSAVNSLNEASAWSATWPFRTLLQPPTLLTPTNNATGVALRPAFTWSDPNTTGVTGYTIQISKDNTFKTGVTTGSSTTTHFTLTTNLTSGSPYFWRVQVKGTNGPSLWPTAFSFSTP